jgi:hypothetical protein
MTRPRRAASCRGCARLFAIGGALATLLVSTRANAYRPFDGTDADVAEPRVFELELGPVNYYRADHQSFLIAPALVLNLGIFEGTELVVDADDYVALGALEPGTARVSLLGDDVLVKHVFLEGVLQGKTGISLAAEGGVLTPEIHGSAGAGASLDVIASYRWSWGTVHWNEWFEYTREHHADLFNGVIVEGPYAWPVRPVTELFFDKDFAGGSTASALVGAIWVPNPSLALDAAVRLARADDDDAIEVRLGLTWSVGLGEEHGAERTNASARGARGASAAPLVR